MTRAPLRSLAAVGLVASVVVAGTAGLIRPAHSRSAPIAPDAPGLWRVYEQSLKGAKYIDLTHTLTPSIPVWKGFGPAKFGPTINPETGQPYTYAKDGFEATRYELATDQFGTQLDPPAHWAPEYPAIDELPADLRGAAAGGHLDRGAGRQATGLSPAGRRHRAWESSHGRIPAGSVVMVRSDWSKDMARSRARDAPAFPGVSLAALKFLHQQRHILFHGHEPLDTDTTPSLEGEYWLMHNGYTQAEGVANLSQVPETGCLVTIGYPKFGGGTGGYARYIAICPPDSRYGVSVGQVPEAPLPRSDQILEWDTTRGMRVRR